MNSEDAARVEAIEALIVERDRREQVWKDTRGGWDQYHGVMEAFDDARAELGDEVPFLLALVRKLTSDAQARVEAGMTELFKVWFAEYDGVSTVGIYSKMDTAEAMLHAVAANYNANREEDYEPMTLRRSQDGEIGYMDSQWNHRAGITVYQLDATSEPYATLVRTLTSDAARGDGEGVG